MICYLLSDFTFLSFRHINCFFFSFLFFTSLPIPTFHGRVDCCTVAICFFFRAGSSPQNPSLKATDNLGCIHKFETGIHTARSTRLIPIYPSLVFIKRGRLHMPSIRSYRDTHFFFFFITRVQYVLPMARRTHFNEPCKSEALLNPTYKVLSNYANPSCYNERG